MKILLRDYFFLLLETEYDNEYDFNKTKKLVLKKCLTYGKTKEEVDEIEKEHLKIGRAHV